MSQQSNTAATGKPVSEFDAIIVGAGVGGLYALHRLRGLGLNVGVFDAAGDVGGTWYWNRYPGCRCDVESMEYSYSFSNELQQEWKWPERYGTQPEILRYVNHVADRFDLRRDIRFNTRVLSGSFDAANDLWTLETDTQGTISAPFCIMATGNLSTPRVPDFAGLESFQGKWYHTGLWPHEGVDFTGLRVGIVGTGSSGVQSIPIIAKQAKHLHVFQRTANFSLPARNAPLDGGVEQRHKAEYPERRKAAFDTPFGISGYPPPKNSALEVSAEERDAAYEAKWAEGGSISFLYAYNDLLVNKEANDTASEFVRNKIRATVRDQKVAELLAPKNHPIGTKRLILDTDYYETYNRDNVTLVDARSAPIEAITADGIRTTEAEYEFDAIVFATGFDAMTGALLDIDLRGSNGTRLKDKWADGPRSNLGLMMADFPNMFMITGPQSPSVKAQMILACEQHTDWIVDCLTHMKSHGMTRIQTDKAAEDGWVHHNNEIAEGTLYPLANSWYMGANIPGKPKIFMPYVGGFDRYKRTCDEIAAKGYEGFTLSTTELAAAAGD
ncbi:MAG: NAD(P)/FAD-dependent oxidoreductase [Rhodospirillaceae bacterium]|jgi:cyclohexanone monooxygenase|nr:NAD(P)/FAD-dependent oxidoreductase [Rhodospirillaceae bacterium]MBT4490972.1 NAD(P)/FAD-dependent oxidoreductase [Rhodospirillaceae bacterium]MBT5898658.1 NAD(P)/FAD-dependent oxidoreductase [Rhodospirillaceae bacterium]MBT6426134.1 NAD(P)/FAD-dependent oxidoreductase [Rhodospirillaceae bacterium]MBT7755769.1 NAD(P)/FAD-dependent oxidoreductase [Rhodospirillaceae bacterium]